MTTDSIALPHTGSTDSNGPPNGPEAQIELYRQDFATVLPSHLKPDTWVRLAQGLLRRDWKLARAAKANVPSFLAALLDCARLGLEPGETYHLVPFGGEIVGIEDYKGLIELMYRAGAVESVKAEIVYEHDEYEYDPDIMSRPRHKPSKLMTGQSNWFATKEQRGEMVGAYCYCEMKSGGTSRIVQMARWEIEEHKVASKTAKSADSMWQKWPRSAWLKTVVKEQSKWVPTSPEWITHKIRAERLDQEPVRELSPAARALPEPSRDVEFTDRGAPPGVIDGEVVSGSAATTPESPSSAQFDRGNEMRRIWAQLASGGIDSKDRERRLAIVTRMLNRATPLGSFNDLTDDEITSAVAFMERRGTDGTLAETLAAMAPAATTGEVEPSPHKDPPARKGKGEMSAQDIDQARNAIAAAKDMAELSEVWNQMSKHFTMAAQVRKAHAARREELKNAPAPDTDALWQQLMDSAPEDWTTQQIEDHFTQVTGASAERATAADMQRYLDTVTAGGTA